MQRTEKLSKVGRIDLFGMIPDLRSQRIRFLCSKDLAGDTIKQIVSKPFFGFLNFQYSLSKSPYVASLYRTGGLVQKASLPCDLLGCVFSKPHHLVPPSEFLCKARTGNSLIVLAEVKISLLYDSVRLYAGDEPLVVETLHVEFGELFVGLGGDSFAFGVGFDHDVHRPLRGHAWDHLS